MNEFEIAQKFKNDQLEARRAKHKARVQLLPIPIPPAEEQKKPITAKTDGKTDGCGCSRRARRSTS